jgi:hypothetical protein
MFQFHSVPIDVNAAAMDSDFANHRPATGISTMTGN